ncbi:pseudaminic acid cytidylyltransferase [Lewinella sp. W8]|uniref:pseudaminic acid cytidylyltransferase n=1 Tax=Lewinella sp. W8 TaxID=2528208 RepID=UPI001067989A|nr:pseudaminic acid cytidylyltransferase [Lewinella sp. W8]MTB53184.1 pseudaminic acid cytidylyltransferase [Lewinella sp. W8]
MDKICIIPARGGSKRIPRKNIRLFLGKPIIAYSIEAAITSNLFDEVMVSTDDEEIAQIAKGFGAEVPFMRSKKNAGDFSTTLEVIEEVLDDYVHDFSEVCCIYATAPFVTSSLLRLAYTEFSNKGYDSCFPVIPYGTPIQRALKRSAEGETEMLDPSKMNARSQDLEPAYFDAGMFYWLRPEKVLPQKRMWTDHSGSIVLSPLQGQDIDTEEDWKLAELKYRLLR